MDSAVAGASQRCFQQETNDAVLLFQIIDLGRQFFVWVSATGPKLGSMYLAIQTPVDKQPAVARVLPGPTGAAGESLAQRLALKYGKPFMVSCNLPGNAPMLQALAEKRLLQELNDMTGTASAGQQAAQG